jgi:hypothetical protein
VSFLGGSCSKTFYTTITLACSPVKYLGQRDKIGRFLTFGLLLEAFFEALEECGGPMKFPHFGLLLAFVISFYIFTLISSNKLQFVYGILSFKEV